jgi:ribosomal protein S6
MENNTQMYELGYLITPLLPEENLDNEIVEIRKIIEDNKGLLMNEERAKLRRLAYTIKKPGIGKYDDGYFGWIKFVTGTENLLEMKSALDKNKNLLRFIIIKIDAETTNHSNASKKITKPKTTKIDVEAKKEIKPEEVDKKLEELLGT